MSQIAQVSTDALTAFVKVITDLRLDYNDWNNVNAAIQQLQNAVELVENKEEPASEPAPEEDGQEAA